MSLKQRAEQHQRQLEARTKDGPSMDQTQITPGTQLYPRGQEMFGIVDNEIVTVLGTTDIPNASLGYICADPDTGWNAPVPYSQVRLFPHLNRSALQALLETERGTTASRR